MNANATLAPGATTDLGATLLALARSAIAERFGRPESAAAGHPALERPGATFVTLQQAGELRGCIGSLEAHRSLLLDVRANAQAAAFHDPRFAPLTARELEITRVEVSLLSAPEPMMVASELALLAALRPGVDGLILSLGPRRATFLPQVWESLPDPVEFVAHLKRKAGLPFDFWSAEIRCSRYTVAKWSEADSPARAESDGEPGRRR